MSKRESSVKRELPVRAKRPRSLIESESSESEAANIPVSAKSALKSDLGKELRRIYSELISLLKKSALPFKKAAMETKEGLEEFVGFLLDSEGADEGIEHDEDDMEDSEESFDPKKAKKAKKEEEAEVVDASEEEESLAADSEAETTEEDEESLGESDEDGAEDSSPGSDAADEDQQ